jgi:hypothetical protein
MLKKLLALLFSSVLVFSLAAPILAQETQAKPEKEQVKKKDRCEGYVARINKEKSTLTVRQSGSTITKTVVYDIFTQWTSQEHGSKKVNDIDVSQVKEEDRVICLGTFDKDGVLHATLISKRLTPR